MTVLGLLLMIVGVGGVAVLIAQNDAVSTQVSAFAQTMSTTLGWLVLASAGLGAAAILGLSMFLGGAARARRRRRERRQLLRERRELQAHNEQLEQQVARDDAADREYNYAAPGVAATPADQAPVHEWPTTTGSHAQTTVKHRAQ